MNFVLFYTIHLCAYFNIHSEVLYQTFFCYMYFEAFDVINNMTIVQIEVSITMISYM